MTREEFYFVLASVIYALLLGTVLLLVYVYIKRLIKHRNQLENLRRQNEASLLQATLTTQEKERERIGANLHDDIGPLLSSVKMFFKNELKKVEGDDKSEIEAFLEVLDENIEQVRDTSRELVPNVLNRFGFKAAIEDIIRRFSGQDGIEFSLRVENENKIPVEARLPLYRIIQESINNAIRHGKATKIQIYISASNGLLVEIKDNGLGFNPDDLKPGLGLRNIEARSKSIFAEYEVRSSPAQGTEIIIRKKKQQ